MNNLEHVIISYVTAIVYTSVYDMDLYPTKLPETDLHEDMH